MLPVSEMILRIAVITIVASLTEGEEKWAWNDSKKDESVARFDHEREPRYDVYEAERPFGPSSPYYDRPSVQYRPELNRPGGVYGGAVSGNYGQAHPHYSAGSGILTGPVPSWVGEGPFKNYDRCKCAAKFNCNSPGISYGHCDVGKQYCCYASTKLDRLGGPPPSRPAHSIENGILVGPGGPVGVPRPGSLGPRPGAGFGLDGGGRGEYGPISHRPIHSLDNGILVGPGGPFNGGRPIGGGYAGGGGYGLGRSTKNK